MERIGVSADRRRLVYRESDDTFVPWGFNHDRDERSRLLEELWLQDWDDLVQDFAHIAAVGGNVVRIHLQCQGLMRSAVFGTPLVAPLLPMTGLVFVLYTNYMITDPGTTPIAPRSQVAFGALTAGLYGLLVAFHVVFGLFFALTLAGICRGAGLYLLALRRESQVPAAVPVRAA